MLLFVAFMATWTSCSKSDDIEANDPKPVNPTPTNPTNPTDKTDPKDDPYMVVCEHVSDVSKNIASYYEQCSSINELYSHLEEMKKVEYVEDIYFSNVTMFVKIKDFGTISYSYFPNYDLSDNPGEAKETVPVYTRSSEDSYGHSSLGLENVAIINQTFLDEHRSACRDISEAMHRILSDAGFRPVEITSPTYEFFRRDFFYYDMICLIGHGSWDPVNKVHWLLTSTQISEDEYNYINKNKLYQFKGYPRDQVSVSASTEGRKNLLGFTYSKTVYYLKVSEKFIDEASDQKFKKPGSVIFFNGACQSVMGGNRDFSDANEPNFSLAEILSKKGVAFYMGYDESNDVGHVAGLSFVGRLASGMSLEMAYNTLPASYLHNKGNYFWGFNLVSYTADLLHYPTDFSSVGRTTITSPWISDIKDNSTDESISVTISATARFYLYLLKNYGELNSYYKIPTDKLKWGIEICESSDFSETSNFRRIVVPFDKISYDKSRCKYSVTLTDLDLIPGTTYYYRAFFFDGKYYNYSNYSSSDKFTTHNNQTSNSDTNTSGQGNLPNVPGSDL